MINSKKIERHFLQFHSVNGLSLAENIRFSSCERSHYLFMVCNRTDIGALGSTWAVMKPAQLSREA